MATDEGVAFIRDEVKDRLADWELIDDCLAGERTVREKRTQYLPMPNADDTSSDNLLRYKQYLARAVFYPVASRTHEGLTALAFIEAPTIVVPAAFDYLAKDIDGAGISLAQQMQATLGKVVSHGRCGLLTDYPVLNAPVSRAAMQPELGIRPIVRTYAPEDIINWRTVSIGARQVPSMVVLVENVVTTGSDGFSLNSVQQWRVLLLLPSLDGKSFRYVVRIYRDTNEGRKPIATYDVLDHAGKPMQYIPFVAVGSRNNDLDVDDPPMLDLASLNIAHWRDSADYQESVFMCGQPTPTVTNMTKEWWEGILKKKIRLGSRSAVALPPGSSLSLVQPTPNGLVREAMQDKERQMVALGARLIQSREVQRTATEARFESASEMSVLNRCAKNVAAGYVQSIGYAGQFAGISGEVTIDIHANAEFERMTPEERRQLMEELQNGGISWPEYRAQMRKGGIALQDDVEAAKEIAARKPATVLPQQQ